tara:strand:- start:289 stop:744 length:456 start_codon:yes stop_codon:yes gene_type:complete
MRKIKQIVVHCSATREGNDHDAEYIDKMHRARGWKGIGYNYVIKLNGDIENGRSIEKIPAGVFGHNRDSVHVVYIGGLDEDGKPTDTRTNEQKHSLRVLLESLKLVFNKAVIKGHRDFSPDKNGNGIIDKWEWIKACPCFDCIEEYKDLNK